MAARSLADQYARLRTLRSEVNSLHPLHIISLRQRISGPTQKTFAGDEKIFPFTGQNRRTAIRVESQRIAKTDDERRRVEDGRHFEVSQVAFS